MKRRMMLDVALVCLLFVTLAGTSSATVEVTTLTSWRIKGSHQYENKYCAHLRIFEEKRPTKIAVIAKVTNCGADVFTLVNDGRMVDVLKMNEESEIVLPTNPARLSLDINSSEGVTLGSFSAIY